MGPSNVRWFALNHTVNGKTPLSKPIVRAVAPLRTPSWQQSEAEDIQMNQEQKKQKFQQFYLYKIFSIITWQNLADKVAAAEYFVEE